MKNKYGHAYDSFVFFSAGPVGDHAVLIDFANRFFKSTDISSVFIMKHPNRFVSGLSLPYQDHIRYLNFTGIRGFIRMAHFAFLSILRRNCYILIFPIPVPWYLRSFSYYIRFCTRSRIVGFNLEGSRSFPIGKGYASFLGKKNTITMLPEMFYESANRMLVFLGYQPVPDLPKLGYLLQERVFSDFKLVRDKYLVFHVSPSHTFRSLPADRWNTIIKAVMEGIPAVPIVFSGSQKDLTFIHECLFGIVSDRIVIMAGKELNVQEPLTLYANAKLNVTVQTGNGLLIAMLHAPSVVVDIRGTAMFYYNFNENATILFSKKGCTCDPFEPGCNMVLYKGREYMACLFNIPDGEIINAIIAKYGK